VVERWSLKPAVTGSKPVTPSKIINKMLGYQKIMCNFEVSRVFISLQSNIYLKLEL
jgi:hypothetical protein